MDSVNCARRKRSTLSHFDAAPIFATPQSVFITPEPGMSLLINENLPEDAGSLFQKMTYYQ
jgi:hypothetical protein